MRVRADSWREALLGGKRTPRELLGEGHRARIGNLVGHQLSLVGPRFSCLMRVLVLTVVVW